LLRQPALTGPESLSDSLSVRQPIQSQQIPPHTSFIQKWLRIAQPAYEKTMRAYGALDDATTKQHVSNEEKEAVCERHALTNSLNNLLTFPWIKERVDNNTLSLHAWCFDLKTGLINGYDAGNDSWSFL
jgi:carbonic anhydrase